MSHQMKLYISSNQILHNKPNKRNISDVANIRSEYKVFNKTKDNIGYVFLYTDSIYVILCHFAMF